MALPLASMAALVRSFVPFSRTRDRTAAIDHGVVEPPAAREAVQVLLPLSEAAEAALAPLNLPHDGPIEAGASLRARLVPEAAAANFIRWARALDLVGCYSKRSIVALYREFSEVDQRHPIGDAQLFEALDKTEGIRKEQLCLVSGRTKFRRAWQWIIEPASAPRIANAPVEAETLPQPPVQPAVLVAAAPQEPAATFSPPPERKAVTKPAALVTRFVLDEHPFSPAGLREHAKHARRARLNATASRKQRGAVRRAH